MKLNLPRRWTLATCLTATAVIAILLGMRQRRELQSLAAIDYLRSRGASIYYEWQSPHFETRTFVSSWQNGTYRIFAAGSTDNMTIPMWSYLLGRTPATDVHTVVLDATGIDSDLVETLASLPTLRQLLYRQDGSDQNTHHEWTELLRRLPNVRIGPEHEVIRSLRMKPTRTPAAKTVTT